MTLSQYIKLRIRAFKCRRKFNSVVTGDETGSTRDGLAVIAALLRRKVLMGVQLEYCEKYLEHKRTAGSLSTDMVTHLIHLKQKKAEKWQ